jgi:hypothetical protein
MRHCKQTNPDYRQAGCRPAGKISSLSSKKKRSAPNVAISNQLQLNF